MTVRILGIDASNIRGGGGVTHLQQLLGALDPTVAGIQHVIVWGNAMTLAGLPTRTWLEKRHVSMLDRSLPFRIWWQQAILPAEITNAGCAALFSPGGTVPVRHSVPVITMFQNLLPFEAGEARRFGILSWMYWKMLLLRWVQTASFGRADGVICLSQYAREQIMRRVRITRDALVPHGIEPRFLVLPRPAQPEVAYSMARPFRLLYVSIIDVYKHQTTVAQAVADLRRRGLPLAIDFAGPAYAPALERLRQVMRQRDPHGEFLRYIGPVPFEQLHVTYRNADAFVFASSCENMPNILLEAMASGLAIACSDRGPMPEVLGDAGIYFNPESRDATAAAIERLYREPDARAVLARKAYERAAGFTWEKCARETLAFIRDVAARRVAA